MVILEGQMKKISYPFTKEQIRELKVGDQVLITGILITARDAAHKYLHEGNKSPVDLKNQIIYHCGPVVKKNSKTKKYEVLAAGPTTSIREEPYEWELIKNEGIIGVIGKGGMGKKTLEACKEFCCVYFHAIGGAAQVLAENVVSVEDVFLLELGSPEAMWVLNVKDFPVVVTMDSYGQSLHDEIQKISEENLKKVLE